MSQQITGLAEAISTVANLAQKAQLSTLDTIKAAGHNLGPGLPDSIPVWLVQNQDPRSVRTLIEEWRQTPERWTGTATVTTLQSFVDLVSRHKNENRSAIFARTQWPDPSLTAVIDYSGDEGEPRHRKHRIHYPFPVTDEFKTWVAYNGKTLSQADFANFLEERAIELAAPDPGEIAHARDLLRVTAAAPNDLIDLSRGLQINAGLKAVNKINPQTGEGELTFTEEHTNAKGEPIIVPGAFVISLPVFLDGDPVRLIARLRYRLKAGEITWAYLLYRWENLLRERAQNDLLTAGGETGLPTFEGSPEPA